MALSFECHGTDNSFSNPGSILFSIVLLLLLLLTVNPYAEPNSIDDVICGLAPRNLCSFAKLRINLEK